MVAPAVLMVFGGLASLLGAPLGETGPGALQVVLRLDLGRDHGQPFGTLWEAVDAQGRPMAGAGFLNAYNTQDRSDRRMLHVYVRTQGEEKLTLERLPRPSGDAGTYLFGFDGRLFAKGRGATDNQLRVWLPDQGRWEVDENTVPFSIQVAGKVMAATARQIRYDGWPILELAPGQGVIGEWYYAAGRLVVRRQQLDSEPVLNELIAFDWTPGQRESLSWEGGCRFALSAPREFIYAFGVQDDDLVAASNLGGVQALKGRSWRTLRAPDGRSFQIYSTLNTAGRLLLGQYPTGELFEYAGGELRHLPGWPPVMPGVSRNAREAQTLAIYGGDIYVGVWPWGEIWRQSRVEAQWRWMGRAFTHPEPTDRTTHPYEDETKALDAVLNRWGQRVTSLVPLGDSLYVATSAKASNPYEEKFTFLAGDKHFEYGAVYRHRQPGCLAVPIKWKDGPTRFAFQITARRIEIWQDGARLGATEWDEQHPSLLDGLEVRAGAGVFGPFRGSRIELNSVGQNEDRGSLASQRSSSIPTNQPPRLSGAYVHLHKMLDANSDAATQEAILRHALDRMKEFGLNAVLPFVSTSSGQAHYDSALLPGRAYSKSDPVKILAREARTRGLEFHPVVPVVVCGNEQQAGILLQHPEWALRHPDGRAMGYLSPAHPEARKWLADVVREIVANYQPDGVVLDYIRYANRAVRLDAASEERFRRSLPADCPPAEEKRLFQRFKEGELTELVREIAQAARAERPGLKLAAYCWGAHVAKDHAIAQVWPLWVERGYLDMVNISGYCHRETYGEKYLQVFEQRLSEAREINQRLARPAALTFALGVVTSHGRVQSADDIRDYLEIADRLKLDGVAYFTWEYLQPYVDELKGGPR